MCKKILKSQLLTRNLRKRYKKQRKKITVLANPLCLKVESWSKKGLNFLLNSSAYYIAILAHANDQGIISQAKMTIKLNKISKTKCKLMLPLRLFPYSALWVLGAKCQHLCS